MIIPYKSFFYEICSLKIQIIHEKRKQEQPAGR